MAVKPKRRIKAAKISLISLVPSGANRVTSIFKSRDDVVEMAAVAKIDAQGYLTTLVYLPDCVDAHGDVAKADDIRQWAHDFIPNMEGNGIDVLHDGQPVGNERAHICETFIVQKGDPRFEGIQDDAGNPVDPTGAWGVIVKIDDPDLRSRYATGEWVGVSMFGSAIVEPLINKSTTKENEMDKEQMAELLKSFGTDLSKNIVDGLSKALKPEPSKEEPAKDEPVQKAVEFVGDPNDPADVEQHLEKVLFSSLDMSKPADIQKWQAHLAKKAAKAEGDDPNAAQIQKLEKELAKLKKAPTASGEPTSTPEGEQTVAQKLAKGREIAAELKKQGVIG